jgi:O-antigen/teichoic acid export membrane protein/dienelactone hydrolase
MSRNIGSMLLGRVSVAAMGWIGSILIARSLGGDEWGQYSFVFGLLGVLSVITDLGVGRVVLARLVADDEEETQLVASSFIALRLTLGLVGYVAAVGFVVVAGYPGQVVLATAIAGLVVVIATPSHSLTVLYQSRLKLTSVSVIESLSQLVQLAATIAAVVVAPVLVVVVIPAVLFEVVSLLAKASLLGRGRLGFRPDKRIEIWRWPEMLREALPLSIGFALTVLLTKIDIPLLSKLGSFDAVGHYAIAYKFSDLVSMIGIAVTTPLTTVLVASWPGRIREFRARVHDATVLTILLGGMAVIGIWPAATPLVRLLYGAEYADADDATRLLVVGAGLSSFTLLGVMILVSTGRLRVFPLIAGFGLALNVALNVVLIPRMSFQGSAVATVVTEVLVCVLIWAAVLREVDVEGLAPWRRIAGLLVLVAGLTVLTTLVAPADSVAGIVVGGVGALALPLLARACRLTDGIDPRSLLSRPSPDEDDDVAAAPDPVAATSVTPTWFGPGDTPVFGSLHTPATAVARAGVVICPPLAKEQMDTTRGVRMLAEDLAVHGIVALRMDYLHTGESWGDQDAPDAADNWVTSIRHAVDHLRDMGLDHIALVGLRAGALLATAAARDVDDLDALVLWDPVLRGRTWVRGQQQLFRIAVAADAAGSAGRAPGDDTVDVVGASWHPRTSAALSAMSTTADSLPDVPVLLAMSDTAVTSTPGRALLDGAARSDRTVLPIADTSAFVSPSSFFVELPHDAVAEIGAWLDTTLPTTARPIRVHTRDEVIIDDGIACSVRTVDGATMWITAPVSTPATSAVVLHSTANDIRTGPARLWRDTATRIGGAGGVAVRYDRVGVGESGMVRRGDDFAALHSAEAVRDAHSASDLARSLTTGAVTHVGICSGAWAAAAVALDGAHSDARADGGHAPDRVVLVNLLTWRRDAPVLGADRLPELLGPAAPSASTRVSVRARIKPLAARWAPHAVFDAIARRGWMQSPRLLLRQLARAGVETHLVFGTRDYHHFVGQRGLDALAYTARRGHAATVAVAPGGDHAAFHPVVRAAATTECLSAVDRDAIAGVENEVSIR